MLVKYAHMQYKALWFSETGKTRVTSVNPYSQTGLAQNAEYLSAHIAPY